MYPHWARGRFVEVSFMTHAHSRLLIVWFSRFRTLLKYVVVEETFAVRLRKLQQDHKIFMHSLWEKCVCSIGMFDCWTKRRNGGLGGKQRCWILFAVCSWDFSGRILQRWPLLAAFEPDNESDSAEENEKLSVVGERKKAKRGRKAS